MNLNKAMLIGRLGKDPELKFTGSGKAWCRFSLATSETWYDANNDKQEKTVWHNIVVWGKQAESCHKYLSKGALVLIEGKIDNRSYENNDGETKYISEIIAQRVQFGPKNARRDDMDQRPPGDEPPSQGGGEYTDDDIPF